MSVGASRRGATILLAGAAIAALTIAVGRGDAQPASSGGELTITMLVPNQAKPALDLLIQRFELVYPNMRVEPTYAGGGQIYQLETTELAAGNAPDVLGTQAGCGQPNSICVLAKAGYLAPMIKKPWVKRSLRLVIASDKYGKGLFAYSPAISLYGVYTNDELFRRLGLKIPRTFPQLLDVCRKAKAAGTVAFLLPGATTAAMGGLVAGMSVATVYGKDPHWGAKLRAGAVTFDGSPGWHQALQRLVDMNGAGCFQPGASGTTMASMITQFAQGQGLMIQGTSANKGVIDAANPKFSFSHRVLPVGATASETTTYLFIGGGFSVNAHSSRQSQQGAQTFVDFIARTAQTKLYAEATGGLTQDQFARNRLPKYASSFSPMIAQQKYVPAPIYSWGNANVGLALEQNAIGVITGQRSIDDVLKAMDAAWRQGPQ
jgi:raffinose/stachyose/melibiose transport system substrate-binding protein